MKLLKMIIVFVWFGLMNAAQDAFVKTDVLLTEFLYTTYDQYTDNFIQHLPRDVSIELCKQVLLIEQEELKDRLNSLSYKNTVLFSEKNIRRMGLLVAGVAGVAAVDLFMHKKLEDVTLSIAHKLASGPIRDDIFIRLSLQEQGLGRPNDPQIAGGLLRDLRGRVGSSWENVPALSLTNQLIGKWYGSGQNLTYSAYLTLYQIVTKVLALGTVVAGAGLVHDIKALRERKRFLSEQYEKCTKMLELLG